MMHRLRSGAARYRSVRGRLLPWRSFLRVLAVAVAVVSPALIVVPQAGYAVPGAEQPSYTGDTTNYLRKIAHRHPDIARFSLLGYSREGRSIASVVLSSSYDPRKPSIYFNGGHHGNEQASVIAVLGLLQHYVRHRHDPLISQYLEAYNFIFQPVINPDGLANGTRSDSRGQDPNRDYPYLVGGELRGGFAMPETRIVKQVHERYNIIGALAVHSGMEGVLWPWGFTDELNPHHRKFIHLSERMATAMGFQYFRQSFYDYETRGEYIDWAYLRHGTLALTVEVTYEHTPAINRLNGIVKRTINGTRSYLAALLNDPFVRAH